MSFVGIIKREADKTNIMYFLDRRGKTLNIRNLLTLLLQTTFENTTTEGEIAQNKQFSLKPQWFQLFLIIQPLFMKSSHVYVNIISKSSAVYVLYVGRGIYKSRLVIRGLDVNCELWRHYVHQSIRSPHTARVAVYDTSGGKTRETRSRSGSSLVHSHVKSNGETP